MDALFLPSYDKVVKTGSKSGAQVPSEQRAAGPNGWGETGFETRASFPEGRVNAPSWKLSTFRSLKYPYTGRLDLNPLVIDLRLERGLGAGV